MMIPQNYLANGCIISTNKTSENHKSQPRFRLTDGNYLKIQTSRNQFSIFNIQGKQINKTVINAGGIFVYKAGGIKTPAIGKLIVR